ncbi:MAG: hypothetical protein V4582_04100 [Pseudomonadota bacterium]
MVAAPAQAGDDGPDFYVSGFGSAILTSSNTDQGEFVQNSQAAGAKSGTWRSGIDSNFGMQSTAVFNDTLSVTGQGVVRKLATDNYRAILEWAFLKWKASDELAFRVGRMGIPVYMISDYRFIGYSNTMLRPPVEMYAQVNIGGLDGVDATYKHSFDDTTLTAQFGVGTHTAPIVGGPRGRFTSMTALNLVLENGPITARFGRIDTEATAEDFPAFAAFADTLAGAGYPEQGKLFLVDHAKASFTSLGVNVAWKNVIAQSEYAVRRSATLSIPATTSWYVMAGYRFGKFTPYFVHSTVDQDKNRQVPGLPTTGPLAPLTAVANLIADAPLQTTNSLGLRWNFKDSMDFKVQLDRASPREGAGLFANAKPGFTGPVNVYAFGIDFVF